MKTLSFILSLLIAVGTVQAQQTISVNASAEVSVPADRIAFHITINAEAETPQKAYSLHNKREKLLIQQLKKHGIKEKNIRFDPVTVNRVNHGRYPGKEKKLVQTRQPVTLTLEDFARYEKIQLTLIEHDFDEFNGNFLSSKSEEGENQALRKALKIAEEKARIIAEESNVTITGIRDIGYSYRNRPPQPVMEMAAVKSRDGLMDYKQTVSVSATVSLTYNFK